MRSNKTRAEKAKAAEPKGGDLFDLFDNVEGQEIERSSDFWKPRDVGDILVGFYAGKHDGENGPIADIRTDEGVLIPLGMNAPLQQLLAGDLVGKHVAIQYIGSKATKRSKTDPSASQMREFRVKVITEDEASELAASLDELPF